MTRSPAIPRLRPPAEPAPRAGSPADGQGSGLEVTIRFGPDGRVFVHDITLDLIPALLALCPEDPELRLRARAAEAFARETGEAP